MNSGVQLNSSLHFLFSFSFLLPAFLQTVPDAYDLIYTVFEPDCEFVNQAIFICFTLWNVVKYVYAMWSANWGIYIPLDSTLALNIWLAFIRSFSDQK